MGKLLLAKQPLIIKNKNCYTMDSNNKLLQKLHFFLRHESVFLIIYMEVMYKMNMYISANKYFNNFINHNFDMNDEKILHKIKHTYQVVNNAKYICEKLNLDELNTDIAMVIALLHDIGRFTQAKEMKTFREDITSFDHATLGVKWLFEKNEIRNFVSSNEYDEIIEKAISNHSKYILDESELSDKEILHCKIIRDADKIDSFRAKTEDDIYTMANIHVEDIENSKITDKIYRDFMNEKTILSKDRKTGIDIWISYIAFIFGLEFKCSYQLIKEKDYINKLFDRFEYKLDATKMNELRIKALNYLDQKIAF